MRRRLTKIRRDPTCRARRTLVTMKRGQRTQDALTPGCDPRHRVSSPLMRVGRRMQAEPTATGCDPRRPAWRSLARGNRGGRRWVQRALTATRCDQRGRVRWTIVTMSRVRHRRILRVPVTRNCHQSQQGRVEMSREACRRIRQRRRLIRRESMRPIRLTRAAQPHPLRKWDPPGRTLSTMCSPIGLLVRFTRIARLT